VTVIFTILICSAIVAVLSAPWWLRNLMEPECRNCYKRNDRRAKVCSSCAIELKP
jgi:hypothetical protein